MTCRLLLLLSVLAAPAAGAQSWESAIVSTGPDGRLQYATDGEGNRVPDFSRAGYRGGGVELPVVPTVRTLAPVEGDDTASIQAALDAVMALPMGADGRRGALELSAGTYEIAGTLVIRASGVVLRGAGDGDDPTASTVLRRSGANPEPVVYVGRREHGSGDALIRRAQGHASAFIEDDVVPVGAWSFRVDHPERLRPGVPVVVYHPATAEWLDEGSLHRLAEAALPDPAEVVADLRQLLSPDTLGYMGLEPATGGPE